MANEHDSDLLPVKETPPPLVSNRIELQLISKLKRGDLEERFIRIYEANIELKKEIHCQDVKIRKLGTKLLRVTNESKNNSRFGADSSHCDDEIKIKLLELERENYALRDRNTVLKQQLASHSRQHMAAHRSPIHVNRPSSSSRLSQRHTSVPNVNGETFGMPSRRHASELQLHDAEAHISALSEEVKMLQGQNEELHKQLEQSLASSKQSQLNDNIELIKLRRQKKQIEGQLQFVEHSQKLLQQDIVRLQRENEDALQIIAEKQTSLIDLQGQLNEAGRFRMECQELKGMVTHLTAERDILKARCDELTASAEEATRESSDYPLMKEELADLRQEIERIKKARPSEMVQKDQPLPKASSSTQTEKSEKTIADEILPGYKPYNILDRLALIAASNPAPIVKEPVPVADEKVDEVQILKKDSRPQESKEDEKMRSENVMLRELLRGQKDLSLTLESQISRMRQELRMKDERYRDVFQQRDLFYRLLDKTSHKEDDVVVTVDTEKSPGTYTKNSPVRVASAGVSKVVADSVVSMSTKEATSNKGTFTKNSPLKTPVPTKRTNVSTEVLMRSNHPSPVKSSPLKVNEAVKPAEKTRVSSQRRENGKLSVTISWLQLVEGSYIESDESIKALYVDFVILSQSSEDFETPEALPKPRAGAKTVYDFSVDVCWNDAMKEELLKLKKVEDGVAVMVFNVVSEPPDEDDAQKEVQCLVIGVSSVSLETFLSHGPDGPEEDLLLPIYDEATRTRCFGTLAVRLTVPSSIKELC